MGTNAGEINPFFCLENDLVVEVGYVVLVGLIKVSLFVVILGSMVVGMVDNMDQIGIGGMQVALRNLMASMRCVEVKRMFFNRFSAVERSSWWSKSLMRAELALVSSWLDILACLFLILY